MTLTTPLALLLLLLVPVIVYLGWPRNRFRRTRDITSLILRVTIVTLLVLALAGVQVAQSADRLAVVFLVDVSDSVNSDGDAEANAEELIREALEEMQPDDLAGVITFGADAQVARPLSSARELTELRTSPNSGNTNFAAAIRLGLALFPADAARRIVVLSDGHPTVGDTQGAVQLARAAEVEISYVPFTRDAAPELLLRDVRVPTVLDEDQSFDMVIEIESEVETRARVTVRSEGQEIIRQEIDVREGVNNYTLGLRSGVDALLDFDVDLEALEDGTDNFTQNNSLGAFSLVEGVSRVLVINGEPENDDEIQFLVPALQESGIEVDVSTPTSLPIGLAPLLEYDSVVLVNVSAVDLSTSRMETLRNYVADLGGGLVVIGGPQAYGPGGYFQTPLEEALPVEMRIRDQQRLPQLTIAYLVDRSGSMGAVSNDGIPNIDLAKEAIIRSIDFLQPNDRAAVISFDQTAVPIADFQNVNDRRELQRLVATLRPSGGTSIMAGMEYTADEIVQEPSEVKHIILLTDGIANPGGLIDITEGLNENFGVTTSVVALSDATPQILPDMARVGGGNFHQVAEAANIPQIFALETVLASRTYIQEEEFVPTLTARHPIMQNFQALPPLQGYVATTPRDTAQVILRGPAPFEDPVLAAWQFGLGRSVAFTSDATARWAQDWLTLEQYSQFWSQAVRWTITEGTSNNLETRVLMEDEEARVIVNARDNSGEFLNNLQLQATVTSDMGDGAEQINLQQIAPGRYEATFRPDDPGAYFLFVADRRQTDSVDEAGIGLELNQTIGWVMSYSPEYEIRDVDDRLLESIAETTAGRDMSGDIGAAFDHNLDARTASVPIWPWLLLMAMLLLPLDIAVRRLLVTRTDIQRLSAWVRAKVRPDVDVESVERMSTLKEARDRARSRTRTVTTNESAAPLQDREPGSAASSISQLRQRRDGQQTISTSPAPEPDKAPKPAAPPKPKRPAPQQQSPKPQEGNIGSRLLKRRRNDDEK